ncbi:hypothetical protein PGIGA_G00104920, partial [Pangasianodon gigas]|nr:hypothetical protein [Pangasianodon gigas]
PGLPIFTVITVSVILPLLLTGIIFLTFTLLKRCKMQAGTASICRHSKQDSRNGQGVSLAVCDYEEEKSAEDLTYTSMIIYSNATSSNDVVPSIKDEVLCDYTSVSYAALTG